MVAFNLSQYLSQFGRSQRQFQLGLTADVKAGKFTIPEAQKIVKFAEGNEMFVEEEIVIDRQMVDQGTAKTSLATTADVGGQNLSIFSGSGSTTIRLRGYRFNPKIDDVRSIRGFNAIMMKIRKHSNNLKPLFKIINADFFSTNKAERFSQVGGNLPPAYFSELGSFYKNYKADTGNGNAYPILVLSGDLMRSLTNHKDSNAISNPGAKSLQVGTRLPYAALHQEGGTQIKWRSGGTETTEVPARPPVSVGSDKRFLRWLRYSENYMTGVSKRDFANV